MSNLAYSSISLFNQRVRRLITVFFVFYVLLWTYVGFKIYSPKEKSLPITSNTSVSQVRSQSAVLGESNSISHQEQSPSTASSYSIVIPSRKQSFNLSCEFAAALAILYQFTNDETFSPINELNGEKTLMAKIGTSLNPNLGIRMGGANPLSENELYASLNQGFGGADYYGIHAPPFIDLFAQYNLNAKPITKNQDLKLSLQEALQKGHLLMAWIKLGYKEPIDVALSYGSVPVIRGEHTVVVTGYDSGGVFVMDPAIGGERYIQYNVLIDAMQPFPIPLLEVSLGKEPLSLENVYDLGSFTGLDRRRLMLSILNGSRKIGSGQEMASILQDFGYHIESIRNADSSDYEDVTVRLKEDKKDYLHLLRKDLTISSYTIASIAADLSEDSQTDVIITVGK